MGRAGKGSKQPTPALEARPAAVAIQTQQTLSQAQSLIAQAPTLGPQERNQLVAELEDEAPAPGRVLALPGVRGLLGEDILMRNGDRYALGETIAEGLFKGRYVVEVDRRRREVVLDDKSRVRLGRLPQPVPEGQSPDYNPQGFVGRERVFPKLYRELAPARPEERKEQECPGHRWTWRGRKSGTSWAGLRTGSGILDRGGPGAAPAQPVELKLQNATC